jgi:hypothetical protein
MVSTSFVMVSTIAFMGGEGGTEAMVEAYSVESPMISRRVLPLPVLGGCRAKVLITCCE